MGEQSGGTSELQVRHERAESPPPGASAPALVEAVPDAAGVVVRLGLGAAGDGDPPLQRFAPAQRQQVVAALQRIVGNAAVQRRLRPDAPGTLAQGRPAVVRRQHVQMASGNFVGDRPGPLNNRREEVLQAMDRLHLLWSMSNADYGNEYPVIQGRPPGSAIPPTDIPLTRRALTQNQVPSLVREVAQHFLSLTLAAGVGQGQQNAKADINQLQDALLATGHLPNAPFLSESLLVVLDPGPNIAEGSIPQTIAAIARLKAAIVAGTFGRDLFAGTRPVTPHEQSQVAAIMTPGASVSASGALNLPGPMTGTGPGGAFELAMMTSLQNYVAPFSADFRRRLTAQGTNPNFSIGKLDAIADSAQAEVERHFGAYLSGASRQPADRYHPGTYSLRSRVAAASTGTRNPADPLRVIDPSWRLGFVDYFMRQSQCTPPPCPQAVVQAHQCVPTRNPDSVEYERVKNLFATNHANIVDDAIRAWPAEAGTGTVFVDLYREFRNADEERTVRWDLFTTLIHEMLHVLAHPNYNDTSNRIGGTASQYLNEGLLEVLRHDLWDGPGNLRGRLATADAASLRQQVEGAVYPYNSALVLYHPDYAEYTGASQIASRVGIDNVKAAFFLGHTNLLGLGQGTPTTHSLAGAATYQPADVDDAQIVVAGPADTYAGIQSRTNAPAGSLKHGVTGRVLKIGEPLFNGLRVWVPGIRWVPTVTGDSLGSIARQHNVALVKLAEAQGLPSNTPGTHSFSPGTRVLIPIHASNP